jgi:hypothetical protein
MRLTKDPGAGPAAFRLGRRADEVAAGKPSGLSGQLPYGPPGPCDDGSMAVPPGPVFATPACGSYQAHAAHSFHQQPSLPASACPGLPEVRSIDGVPGMPCSDCCHALLRTPPAGIPRLTPNLVCTACGQTVLQVGGFHHRETCGKDRRGATPCSNCCHARLTAAGVPPDPRKCVCSACRQAIGQAGGFHHRETCGTDLSAP